MQYRTVRKYFQQILWLNETSSRRDFNMIEIVLNIWNRRLNPYFDHDFVARVSKPALKF